MQIDHREPLETLIIVIAAGSETSVNLIVTAVHALLTQPDHLTLLRAGKIDWDDVIEESLGSKDPAMHMPLRYAVADIDLGQGVLIRKGEPILIVFAAAGRDPELHPENPDEFNPTRESTEPLAFGAGPHYCLGAPLADSKPTSRWTRCSAGSPTSPSPTPTAHHPGCLH